VWRYLMYSEDGAVIGTRFIRFFGFFGIFVVAFLFCGLFCLSSKVVHGT